MEIVGMIAGFGSLVCWIMTLVQMFKKGGALQGILGIITCGIWAFIWGWLNVKKTDQKTVMMAWTVCFILSVIGNYAALQGLATPA